MARFLRSERGLIVIAGRALFAADRLTDGKNITPTDIADTASTPVLPSMRYSQEKHDIAAARIQPTDAVAGLVQAD